MCGLSALSASGRFSVMVALWPSTSYLMVSYDRAELCDIGVPRFVLECHRPSNVGGRRCRNAARPSLKSLGPARQFEVEQFLRHGLGQGRVLTVVDGLLGQADRDGGSGGQSCQQIARQLSSSSAGLTARWIRPQSAASVTADLLAEQQHLAWPGPARPVGAAARWHRSPG